MISKIYDLQNQPTNIKEELDSINVIHKSMLDSDIKPSTIPEQCPIIKKESVELPVIPNIQSQYDQAPKEHIQLIKTNLELIDESYKLIIVGASAIGKSSIIERFFKGVYNEDAFNGSIGIDFQHTLVKFNNKVIRLQVWDTAGTEKYRSLCTSYYRGAHGVFVTYDITNKNSLLALPNWIGDITEYADPSIVKILVGNKCDDILNRKISTETGQRISNLYKFPFLEVSSKTNENINKLFYTMISKLHKSQEQPMQNSQPTQNVIKLKSISYEKKTIRDSSDKCSC